MKLVHLLLAALFVITLTACTPPTKNSTTQPAPGTTPQATLNEPDLSEGKYQAYSAEKMAMLKGEQKFGVFFHADWCPTCRKWEKRTSAALDELPEGTLILKANYDEETDLAKELHVKAQSSMVWFDSNGEIIDTVSDPSVEAISKFFDTPDFNVLDAADDRYTEYEKASFDAALGEEKMVVFFHADWCSACRKWERDLQAGLSRLSDNARIIKADFDTDLDLRQEYKIVRQSTAAFINADGSVEKTEADPTIESLNAFFGQTKADAVGQTDERYLPFEQTAFDTKLGTEKLVVFFHADWCPTCQKWEKNLQANLDTVSDNVRILKANFDTEGDLREVFGVTQQSTAVFINADASVAKTESDPSLASVNEFFAS